MIPLKPGESLTFYTDGITEAMSASDELYSYQRLLNQLASDATAWPCFGRRILDDVTDSSATAPKRRHVFGVLGKEKRRKIFHMIHKSFLLLTVAAIMALPLMSQEQEPAKEVKRSMFLPNSLDDEWTKWIVGQWEGSGDSDAGKGKGLIKIGTELNGQFLIMRGESQIAEANPDYLKKTMHASDEEIEQFKIAPYKMLQIYTVDPKTGDISAICSTACDVSL